MRFCLLREPTYMNLGESADAVLSEWLFSLFFLFSLLLFSVGSFMVLSSSSRLFPQYDVKKKVISPVYPT